MRFPAFLLSGFLLATAGFIPAADQTPPPRMFDVNGISLEVRGVGDGMEETVKLELEKQITLSGDKTVSAPLADDLAFFLQGRYLQNGYSDARVDWNLDSGNAVLLVSEGRKRFVGKVTFMGTDPAKDQELQAYLVRQTKEREGRLAKRLPFVTADIDAGIGLVVRRLQADGHLEASAEPVVYTPEEHGDAMDITLTLKPGPVTVFGEVRLAGDLSAFKEDPAKKTAGLTGQPFSEVRLETLRKDLVGSLQTRGWYAAEVVSSLPAGQKSGKPVPALLTVRPGKRFQVTEVQVADGLSHGAKRVAKAVFQAATRQRYAPETLDLLHRRALDTGIFSRLDVEPEVLSDHTLALKITGEEAKPKTLGFYGGYETFKGPILGSEARHVNFLGSGDSVGLRAEANGLGLDGSLQWTDPAIFGSRNALSVSLSADTFSFKDYDRRSIALRSALTRRFARRVTAELFQNFSLNYAESDILTVPELGPEDYSILSAGGRLTLDFRDNPLTPKSGWLAGISVEAGADQGDADFQFVRTDANFSWYRPITTKWRAAAGARFSNLSSSEPVSNVPIDQRLFNGGGTTVRSFSEREMGLESARGSTPLGGLGTTVLNAEISYEILRNLEIAGFADAGTVDRESTSLFSTESMRYAVGLGVRYQLPIGPLRIDYGYNPDQQPGEKAGAFHFTFGFAF